MKFKYEDYQRSAGFIREKTGGFTPQVALILGSGLGFMADILENPVSVDYAEIPGFKKSTAPGHAGRLVFGALEGKKAAVMQGRMHYYEGYSYEETAYAIRTLRLLGVRSMIVTNAAGGVNTGFEVGNLMLITDHIKFFDESPLRGENLPQFGPRFPDCSYLYTPGLRKIAGESAKELGIRLREGVYMYFPGPSYETPAEIRAARILGADAVGMSTVPEVLAAAHCGMEILGISLITNAAAGVLDKPLTEREVLDAADAAKEPFSNLVRTCVKRMAIKE